MMHTKQWNRLRNHLAIASTTDPLKLLGMWKRSVQRIAVAVTDTGIGTAEAVRRIKGEAVREAAELRQTSGELCPRCGWRMVLPGDGCMKCECERLRGEAMAVPKPDAERHAAITIAMNVSAGAEVERPAALRMVQWVLSQTPPLVVDEACRLARDKWPAPESLRRVADWVLSQPATPDPLPATLAALHHSRAAMDRAIGAVEKLTEGRKDWQ